MSEKTPARVEMSFLEYRAIFREPVFATWNPHGALVPALFTAFREWNVGLDNISWKTDPANGSEIEIRFALLNSRVLFTVGLGSASAVVSKPDRSEAELIGKIIGSGVEAVRASVKPEIDRQVVALSMHLKLTEKSLREVTTPFVNVQSPSLPPDKVRAYGFSVYREDSFWVVDASASVPDGLFVKIVQTFPPEAPFVQIAHALDTEETDVWNTLRLRFD